MTASPLALAVTPIPPPTAPSSTALHSVAAPAAAPTASPTVTAATGTLLSVPAPAPTSPVIGAAAAAAAAVGSVLPSPLPGAMDLSDVNTVLHLSAVNPSSPHGCSPLPGTRLEAPTAFGGGDSTLALAAMPNILGDVSVRLSGLAPSGSEARAAAAVATTNTATVSITSATAIATVEDASAVTTAAAAAAVAAPSSASVIAAADATAATSSSLTAPLPGVTSTAAVAAATVVPHGTGKAMAGSSKAKKTVSQPAMTSPLDVGVQVGSRIRELRDEFFVVRFAPLTVEEGRDSTIAAAALEDEAKLISCEFFDTRSGFLRMCQGNNYQFDSLRRAKHSSMMVLWHLHHPQYPAFAHVCNSCDDDIGSDTRYHCDVCEDFDLCSSCISTVMHPHPLHAYCGYDRGGAV